MRKGHAAAGLCGEALSANADCSPENIYEFVRTRSEHDGADVALEVNWRSGYFPVGVAVRPAERDRNRGGFIRQAADASAAGYVREKSDSGPVEWTAAGAEKFCR